MKTLSIIITLCIHLHLAAAPKAATLSFCDHTWRPVNVYTTADYLGFLKLEGPGLEKADSVKVIITGGREKKGETIYLKPCPANNKVYKYCIRFDLDAPVPAADGDLDLALPDSTGQIFISARTAAAAPVQARIPFRRFDVMALALSEPRKHNAAADMPDTAVRTNGWAALPVSDWSGLKKGRRINGPVFGECSPARGPLVMTGHVVVPAGKTLTLLPGSILLSKGAFRLTVRGCLRAEGSREKPVFFSSFVKNPAPGSWKGLEVTGDGAVASLSGCVVEYAASGLTVSGGDSLTVQNCYFRRNGFSGIAVRESPAQVVLFHNTLTASENGIALTGESQPLVIGNIIRDMQAYGIYCDNGARPVIANNIICGNASGGIFAGAGCLAVIERNKLYGNGSGIHCVNAEPMITGNEITGNRLSGIVCLGTAAPVIAENIICYNKLYNINNATTNDIEAPGNWWGEAAMAELYENRPNLTSLFDGHDRPGLGTVHCMPYATEPSGLAGVPKVAVAGFTVAPDPHFFCRLPDTLIQGSRLFFRVTATDINPGRRDAMWVNVTAARTTPQGLALQALETGPGTGVFTGTFMIMDKTVPAYSQLGAAADEMVTVYPVNAPERLCSVMVRNQRPYISGVRILDTRDPMNLLSPRPRFGWHYEDERKPNLARLVAYLKTEQQTAFLRNYYARGSHIPKQCEIQVATDSAFTGILWSSGIISIDDTTAAYTGPPLKEGRTYHARLRAGDGTLWSGWETVTFHLNGRPGRPVVCTPDPAGRVASMYPVLSVFRPFDPEDRTLRFRFIIAADPAFTDTAAVISDIATADTVVSAVPGKTLQENRRYYWKAAARDPYYEQQWSDVASFYVDAVEEEIPLFSLLGPAPDEMLTHGRATLHWQESRDPDPLDTTWYRLEICPDSLFARDVIVIDKLRKNQYTFKKALAAGRQYYWRVAAYTGKQNIWARQQYYSFSIRSFD